MQTFTMNIVELNARELLSYLRTRNIKLVADRDRLRCIAPHGVVDSDLQAILKNRKTELLALLDQASHIHRSTLEPLRPMPRKGELPLSFAQHRLWFLNQLEPDTPAYNIPVVFYLTGPLNVVALEQCLTEIVRRHEVLRTTFTSVDGRPIQVIGAASAFKARVVELNEVPDNERQFTSKELAAKEARRTFDLSQGPLLRMVLQKFSPTNHVVVFTIHHIAYDGWSTGVLTREMVTFYQAFASGKPSPLADPPIQYVDFAHWQRQCLNQDALDKELAYWSQQLAGVTSTAKPALRNRSLRHVTEAPRETKQNFSLTKRLSDALVALAKQEDATLFMTLLTAFKVLLYRYSGRDDVLVGSPIANRERAETVDLIGFFVNTLVMRTSLRGNLSFRELLSRVRQVALEAYAHQRLPFEKLVEELQPERDLRRQPLCEAMFIFEDGRRYPLSLSSIDIAEGEFVRPRARSNVDLYVWDWDGKDGIQCCFVSQDDRFDTVAIARLVRRFQLLLESIVRDPSVAIDDLEVDSALDLPRLLRTPSSSLGKPLSYHQERLWFIDEFETEHVYESSPIYHNLPLILCLDGPVDVKALEDSLNAVIARHEQLRTRIVNASDHRVQVASSDERITLNILELTNDQRRLPSNEIIEIVLGDAQKPFRLSEDLLIRGLLFRVSEFHAIFSLVTHTFVADRASLRIIAEDLAEHYNAFINGRSPKLAELSLQYVDYSEWQRRLPTESLEQLLFYWKHQLGSTLESLVLPTNRPRPAIQTFKSARYSLSFGGHLALKIDSLSRTENVDVKVVFLTAFKLLLHRYAQQEEIVVGTTSLGRSSDGTENVVGPFANLLVLRSRISDDRTVRALLSQVSRTVREAYKHDALPFDRLVRELNPTIDMSRTALFDVHFEFIESIPLILKMGLASAKAIETNLGYGKYDLNMLIGRSNDHFEGVVVFNSDIFDSRQIDQMMKHFEVIVHAMTFCPEQRVGDIQLLNTHERDQQLVQWNSTRAQYPLAATIHGLFEEQVRRFPDRTAVVCGDTSISYRALDEASNRLAHYLQRSGVTADTLVAVCCDRSIDVIVSMLAVLKAGGAYLPVDPESPIQRQRLMLENGGVKFLITKGSLTRLVETVENIIRLDTEQKCVASYPSIPPLSRVSDDNLAYCIHTSGSTGTPKGVLINHREVVGLLINDKLPFSFSEDDVWTMFHSSCFDFSVWEMYGALLHAAKLVIVPDGAIKDAEVFLALLKDQNVTVLNQTPNCFANLANRAGASGWPALALRYVIFGGEALEPRQLQSWAIAYPEILLVNMYGITETTVHVTHRQLNRAELFGRTSYIGRPLLTATAYILDSKQRLLPLGVRGELYVGGEGLARGYLNRADITAERFIPNPFCDEPGQRMYRSGDLCRYLQNGELEYLGRADRQIKMRGYRIELGEIELALNQHPLVRANAVILSDEVSSQKRLVAYVVPNRESPPSHSDLTQFLREKIPEYMLPATYVMLDAMPRTPSGKTDRRALPVPDRVRPDLDTSFIGPRTSTEKVVAAIWADVLELNSIGIHDHFFELGGHSLLGTQVISRLRDAFQLNLAVRELFDHPTVADLAKSIDQQRVLNEEDDLAEMLAEVERMSEDELQRRLLQQNST